METKKIGITLTSDNFKEILTVIDTIDLLQVVEERDDLKTSQLVDLIKDSEDFDVADFIEHKYLTDNQIKQIINNALGIDCTIIGTSLSQVLEVLIKYYK